jgi:hypothetical protein
MGKTTAAAIVPDRPSFLSPAYKKVKNDGQSTLIN